MGAPYWRAITWGFGAYRYMRNKPRGVKSSRYTAAMIAGMGMHIAVFSGVRCVWLNPAYWLLIIGQHRLALPSPPQGTDQE